MSKMVDRTGMKYGKLTVLGFAGSKNGRAYWKCQCECGNVKDVMGKLLQHGDVVSCGCVGKSILKKAIDISGRRYGKLTVVRRADDRFDKKGNIRTVYLCKCDCGNETITYASNLTSGHSKSCGCEQKENLKRIGFQNMPDLRMDTTKHHKSNTRLYRIWRGMKERCNNPNSNAYSNYGGRGIKVCDEWKNDFEVFYSWAITNGYSDNLSIDRIDVNGNYEPSNCRWADTKTQCNNMRTNKYFTINSTTKTMKQWADTYDMDYGKVKERIRIGWTIEEALELKPRKN